MLNLTLDEFTALVGRERTADGSRALAVPLSLRLLGDQLTPVLAYRRLVVGDERTAPSFLLESVEGGERAGRYSVVGAHPVLEVVARGTKVRLTDRRDGQPTIRELKSPNPLLVMRDISSELRLVRPEGERGAGGVPSCFVGGWVGYAGYDSVRYVEPEKLDSPPTDDRNLADVQFGLYDQTIVFDNAEKLIHVVQLAVVEAGADVADAYKSATSKIEATVRAIQTHSKPLASGVVGREGPAQPMPSNTTRQRHREMVEQALEYIRAGDIFQVVIGQRFERESEADPFDVYRALRTVNPSPYMVYLQAEGVILVASSPEILCRVRCHESSEGTRSIVTNRPLAGTRKRGRTTDEDIALEHELLADAKERAEHIMLVDLGRNDVGRVARPGTIELDPVMVIERYSHVMHISSTVTGELREGRDCWDALAAALPVGTISGAPKVRAMQIIDELEPVKRGPYGGGLGYVGLDGDMDIALALRTMVVPTDQRKQGPDGPHWVYHIQAAGGIVADSDVDAEFEETVNKAAALGRAIDVAEAAFTSGP